jgi:hypothetical protein
VSHGGARQGAGRPKGAINRMTQEAREKAVEGGITPLDYMLSLLRDEQKPEDIRFEAAKAAAPYLHARLASTELSGSLDLNNHEDALDELERP